MITKDTVREFVESSTLVSKKETTIPGVFVLKYKNKCFYDNIWNEVIENTRGAVIDGDYNLIANPFQKIYNYGIESRAPRIGGGELVTAIRKVNGFMMAVSNYKGNLLFSTTGTIDSEYAKMGKELFYAEMNEDQIRRVEVMVQYNVTMLYEVVHPDDPHIIPEDAGVYFLGFRTNHWGSKLWPVTTGNKDFFGKSVGEIAIMKFDDLKEQVKTCTHEGYVVYCDDGRTTKIKSPYYLTKKFFARGNNIEKLLDNDIKQRICEEYYPLVDHIQENANEFLALSEQERLVYIRTFLNTGI